MSPVSGPHLKTLGEIRSEIALQKARRISAGLSSSRICLCVGPAGLGSVPRGGSRWSAVAPCRQCPVSLPATACCAVFLMQVSHCPKGPLGLVCCSFIMTN